MTLEQLQQRKADLDVALSNAANSLYIIQGHKAEIEWQISEAIKANETPVEVCNEVPVE